jgi:hypothetical protein
MKRKTIYDQAIENKLTGGPVVLVLHCSEESIAGFVMPGKPGVACVEGPEEDVKDFVSRIRVSAADSVVGSLAHFANLCCL